MAIKWFFNCEKTALKQQILVICIFMLFAIVTSQSEGDSCTTQSGKFGICVLQSQCDNLRELMRTREQPVTCGFGVYEEVICCPRKEPEKEQEKIPQRREEERTSQGTTKSPVLTRSKERPAIEACNEIEKGLTPGLTPHIIGGINVPLGEYPHMAALGFPAIGSEDYDFRCGGSLIAPRFVLTAAHCVIRRDSSPTIVRLGFVNFNVDTQLREAMNVNIQKIHIHPNYTNSRSYHDIAILELEKNVTYSNEIYPICLYTEPDDPPSDSILYVTGWGVVNTATRMVSKSLLKAKLSIQPVEQCNASYVGLGNRQLPHGLDSTQMCAYDPGGMRDACQGDSGGPLNLVLDESLLNYRLVGITSAGFSCNTLTPSLYTRVSSYLDFIESIVWPKSNIS